MEGHINTYGGLNKDDAYDSIKPNMYIDALDIRITTTTGESQGAFTNIKGNLLGFTIPTSGTFNELPWTITSGGGIPEVIGYGTIRNKIILFVADDEGKKGWIYEVEYDPATRLPSGTTPRLVYYNSSLNFKKEWPIEALGRFENSATQRIYWTDYNNIFRTINIVDPELPSFPVENIDIFPSVSFVQPLVEPLQGSGSLNSGMYQIAYRLITSDGKETLVSPPSNMIHVVSASEYGAISKYVGEPEKVNTFKSIVINLDTSSYLQDFQKIEFFSLYYESSTASPVASSIEIVDLISDVTTLIYQGDETSIFDIELFLFANKNFAFKTFKSVTQKDNYLVGSNIKSSTISLQDLLDSGSFDAKTKRYNNSSQTPFDDTTEENKLNNAFNAEFNKDKHWDIDWQKEENQYKYQIDGVTLGGGDPTAITGDNVSYTFHLEPMTIDVEYQARIHNIGGNIHYGIDNHDLNDGYGIRTNPDGTMPNSASPLVSGLLTGYKRGETYRFGIIFYTIKGEATFVEYIGDIKFPDISEADGANNASRSPYWPLSVPYNSTTGTLSKIGEPITAGLNLGIKFKLNLNTCPELLSKVTSFQIVRLDRTNSNKRRICQGIMSPYAKVRIEEKQNDYDFRADGTFNEVLHHWNTPRTWRYTLGSTSLSDNSRQVTSDLKNDSFRSFIDEQDMDDDPFSISFNTPFTDYNDIYPISGSSGTITNALVNMTIKSQYLSFYSPEISYNFNNIPDLALNAANNASLLVTGCYTAKNSPSPPNAADHRINFESRHSGDPVGNISGNTSSTPGDAFELYDQWYKFRRVGPVSFNSIENIKKIQTSTYFDMRDSSNVYLDTKIVSFPLDDSRKRQIVTPAVSLDPKMPGRDIPGGGWYLSPSPELNTVGTWLRNYYAYIGQDLQSGPYNHKWNLNKPKNAGTDNRSGGVARAGTNISALIESFDKDPLSNTLYNNPGVDKSLRDYFLFTNNTTHPEITDNPHISPLGVPEENGGSGTTNIDKSEAIPIVDLVIPKNEIYGGYSTNALESNSFIIASPVIKINTGILDYEPIVYGGDICISMFHLQKSMLEFNAGLYDGNPDYEVAFSRTDLMATESTVNLNLSNGANLTRGIKFKYNGLVGEIEDSNYRQEDNNSFSNYALLDPGLSLYKTYSYNPVFSQIPKDVLFFIKPSTVFDSSTTNDVRSFLSAVKVNGENIDSWTKFGINDYYDVDDHGPINKIINFKDNVYFFQDEGTGVFAINREAVTTTDDGVPTELGTAKGWGKHQYYSKEVGSIHQWAVATTNNAIYFFDAIHRKIYQLGQSKTGLQTSPLSELKGIHSYLQFLGSDVFLRKNPSASSANSGGDNPILLKGVNIGVDEINDEVIFSFLSTTDAEKEIVNTLVFDEVANQFSTRFSINPKIWINNGNTLLSSNRDGGKQNEIYIHNIGNWGEFYGRTQGCLLKLVINPKADINKVLRFLEFNSIVRDDNKEITREETITSFRITTETQDSGTIAYSPDRIKRRFDKWRIKLPRDKDSRGRFRSTYFLLTLSFNNNNNKELIMNKLISYYDPQIF